MTTLADKIKSLITAVYQEEADSTFQDGNTKYSLNVIFKATEHSSVIKVPLSKLTWQLDKAVKSKRENKADIKVPILIWHKGGKWIVVDGMHRLEKAMLENKENILAKVVSDAVMRDARL